MKARKIDANQRRVVKELRQMGCSVAILSAVGDGCPDILVGYRGTNVLMELKDGDKSPSRRQLTPDQKEFHDTWHGPLYVVESPAQAVDIMSRVGHSRILPETERL